MKKLLAMLLSLMMVFALIPATLAEDADYTLVIEGGDVADHLEMVNGKNVLAVDVKLDEAVAATFDGDNIKFTVVADPALAETSDVTLTLDLTNYDSTAHTGAVFTISPQLNAN